MDQMNAETLTPENLTRATTPAVELCVVVPVLNEALNVGPLVAAVDRVLAGVAWEIMFVDDDSRDGTREVIADIARTDPRIRMIHRVGRRGLSSAFIEGAQASIAPYIAAMDGDLQHDEAVLPKMLAALKDSPAGPGADIAIGSRYVPGGGIGEWDAKRAGMSNFATKLGQMVLKTEVADPMSGFFMLRRATFDAALRNLSAIGFKILLDIIASLPTPPRIVELPFQFRTRVSGESKLDAGVMRDYLLLLVDKTVGHLVPVRFVLFAGVGSVGIVLHMLVLLLVLKLVGEPFGVAQGVATFVAILGNFVMNNLFTFGDRRLRGARAWGGLALFALICGVGAIGNLSVAAFLFGPQMTSWWIAGLVGAVMSLVWNYAVSSAIIWRR
jgi:dolichol-phosphate mannosyltransferase